MTRRRVTGLVSALLWTAWAPGADAADDGAPAERYTSTTEHRLAVPGGTLEYTATVGEFVLRGGDDEADASLFAISYEKKGIADRATRPVTFIFNGGPGSSSVWLHLGLVGPMRVVVEKDGTVSKAPPYELNPNPATLLRASDLVFVDPIGTGYSHTAEGKEGSAFWGTDEDADSVAEFIRLYLSENGRWNSPKYLLGESYGTIRASMLVDRLQTGLDASVFLNGVILVSPAIDVSMLPFSTAGNDLPFIGHLPSFAATAWYHDRLPERGDDFDAFIDEVIEWASTDYLLALFKGDRLDDGERRAVAERLRGYTGLDVEYILRSDLRINALRFTKELLRDRGETIGLLDGRFVADQGNDVGEFPDIDPSGIGISGPFISMMNEYLKTALKVDLDREYQTMNFSANQGWKRPANGNSFFSGYFYGTPFLAAGAAANDDLRFMVVSGYHDLTTAFFASRYMMDHSGIEPDRIWIRDYFGGHMMYLYEPSFEQLADDLVAFVEGRAP